MMTIASSIMISAALADLVSAALPSDCIGQVRDLLGCSLPRKTFANSSAQTLPNFGYDVAIFPLGHNRMGMGNEP